MDASTTAIQWFLGLLTSLWNFMLPFGFTVGVLILVITGIPILIWAFRRFFGG